MVATRQIHSILGSHSPLSDGRPVPCVVMRGGTSRGLFFHEHDLPRDPRLRDRVIMGAVGAPDPRQVDGLGGADMLLSKTAIISRSTDPDADIECEFANITPGKDRPTYGTNCGNLVAAVALFAIDEGLVSPQRSGSAIRIRNRNSGDLIDAGVGALAAESNAGSNLSGMSDTGVCIRLDFVEPVGTVQNTLLPTGTPRETVEISDGRKVDISVVDAGALYVFVRAADLGLTATETADEFRNNPETTRALEQIRSVVAHKLGLAGSVSDATQSTPDVPKLAFVGPPTGYRCNNGSASVEAGSIDLVSRIVSSQNYHNAYAVTGAIATAVAAAVPGSTVSEAVARDLHSGVHEIRIGHPSGAMTCRLHNQASAGNPDIPRVGLTRTARRIMQGTVTIPNSCY